MLLQIVICVVAIGAVLHLSRILNRKPFLWLTNDGQYWAVVTGAGSGMGFEYSRQLALKGYNLMLISLFEEELEEAKQKILQELQSNRTTKIQIRTLVVDFSRLDIYERVEQFLAPFKEDIFVLVNNVGVMNPIPDFFLGNDYSSLNAKMINVNIVSTTRMLELVLPSMVNNCQGLVISMSSIASSSVFPLVATYGATKAYISQLTKCLAAEYGSNGITFATFSPVVVSTPMTHNLSSSLTTPSSRDYVQSALKSIKYIQSFQSSGYWVHSLIDTLLSLCTFIFTQELLSKILLWFLCKARKALLNVKQMEHKPKLDWAPLFDNNHRIWRTD